MTKEYKLSKNKLKKKNFYNVYSFFRYLKKNI